MNRRRSYYALGTLVGLFLVLQLVPVTVGHNPPVEEEVAVPPEVEELLRESCYDCHSNETRWPWYSHVAPASWLVARDVEEGRRNLNFSTWNRYDARDRVHNWEEIVEVLEAGEMPPRIYLPLHPDSRLTDEEAAALHQYAATRMAATESGVEPRGDSF